MQEMTTLLSQYKNKENIPMCSHADAHSALSLRSLTLILMKLTHGKQTWLRKTNWESVTLALVFSRTLTWGRPSRYRFHVDDIQVRRHSTWCEHEPVLCPSRTSSCIWPVQTPGSCQWKNCQLASRCLCSR